MADHYQTIPKNFNKIIAYGCSHTAGAELADHLLLGIDIETCNKLKKNYNSFDSWVKSYINDKKIQDQLFFPHGDDIEVANKKLSFVQKIADRLGVMCENNSIGGNSQQGIYYQLINDHIDKKITPNDLILICNTLPTRILLIGERAKILPTNSENGYASTPLSQLNLYQLKEILNWQSLEHIVWNYFNTLSLIKNYCSVNNIQMIMLLTESAKINPCLPDINIFNHYEINEVMKSYIQNVWFDLRKSCLLSGKGLDSFSDNDETPFFHYMENTHRKFADFICKKF